MMAEALKKRRAPNRVYATKGSDALNVHIDIPVTTAFKARVAAAAVECDMSTTEFARHLLRTGMGEAD